MKFMIYSQDKQDGLPIRKANRDAHLAFLNTDALVKVLSAGPWLDDTGEIMSGSLIIVEAETLGDVHEWLKNDPYAKAGLPASVTVHPFIWAIGAP
jgi:uncharacterized protein YciI